MGIEIQGVDSLIERLDGLVDDAKMTRALGRACSLVERSAKQKAQALGGTGDLARSITSKVDGDIGVVYTPLEYAPYVEFGTGLFAENGNGRKEVPWVYVKDSNQKGSSKRVYTPEEAQAAAAFLQSKGLDAVVTYGQHPHPYLRPALNENRENIKRILKESIVND